MPTPATGHLASAAAPLPPSVSDLGKQRRKRIDQLKKGRGALAAEIAEIVEQVREQLGSKVEGKEILPVAIVYQRKRKRRKKTMGMFPFS